MSNSKKVPEFYLFDWRNLRYVRMDNGKVSWTTDREEASLLYGKHEVFLDKFPEINAMWNSEDLIYEVRILMPS